MCHYHSANLVLLLPFPLSHTIIDPFSSITACRFLTFFYGGLVVFTVFSDEMRPTETDRTQFTIQLLDLDNWGHFSQHNLHYNEVTLAESSQETFSKLSKSLREFQECLRRKRYINNGVEDVRAVVVCCRPPDLRCPRNMRRFRALGPGIGLLAERL